MLIQLTEARLMDSTEGKCVQPVGAVVEIDDRDDAHREWAKRLISEGVAIEVEEYMPEDKRFPEHYPPDPQPQENPFQNSEDEQHVPDIQTATITPPETAVGAPARRNKRK